MKNERIANLITRYDIARNLFTDILFQHGVDKIYYYGHGNQIATNESEFVRHLLRNEDSFGLPPDNYNLFDPMHMISIGCDIKAHVDLNLNRYLQDLRQAYSANNEDIHRKIISRMIGIFEPYEIIEIPVLNTKSAQVKTATRSMGDRVADLKKFYQQLALSGTYGDYQQTMLEIGEISSPNALERHLSKMDEALRELIVLASSISKGAAALLSIARISGHILLDKKSDRDKFNPLLLNLDHHHKQASLSALDRIMIR